jgi:hypothetical protein
MGTRAELEPHHFPAPEPEPRQNDVNPWRKFTMCTNCYNDNALDPDPEPAPVPGVWFRSRKLYMTLWACLRWMYLKDYRKTAYIDDYVYLCYLNGFKNVGNFAYFFLREFWQVRFSKIVLLPQYKYICQFNVNSILDIYTNILDAKFFYVRDTRPFLFS